jgi:hypothetical protein
MHRLVLHYKIQSFPTKITIIASKLRQSAEQGDQTGLISEIWDFFEGAISAPLFSQQTNAGIIFFIISTT